MIVLHEDAIKAQLCTSIFLRFCYISAVFWGVFFAFFSHIPDKFWNKSRFPFVVVSSRKLELLQVEQTNTPCQLVEITQYFWCLARFNKRRECRDHHRRSLDGFYISICLHGDGRNQKEVPNIKSRTMSSPPYSTLNQNLNWQLTRLRAFPISWSARTKKDLCCFQNIRHKNIGCKRNKK